MRFSDEMLMAYADGELDLVARAEIEAAMARDPQVAEAVERHRGLKARLQAAYGGVLDERVPDRLANLAAGPSAKRAAMRLPQWAALAASLAIGLFVGGLVVRGPSAAYEETETGLVARGELETALTTQLASAPSDADVRVGISFRDREGDYCRTFQMHRGAPLAGLACRSDEEWKLEVLATAPVQGGDLRPAASMPMAVLHAIDAAIDGAPLDAAAESAARDAGWRKPRNVAQ